ncbi:MAG: hypothetical protein NTY45_09370 [Elusimicrobia bacterium]|nr:hypothetical protein [Elusimicrobiota bacterium]
MVYEWRNAAEIIEFKQNDRFVGFKVMKLRDRQSDETLRVISGRIIYELGMLQQTCRFARAETIRGRKNAFLESWTIHARNLLYFFYSPNGSKKCPRRDDVIAEDFFNEESVWRLKRPTKSLIMKNFNRRVGKEIAHLTYVGAFGLQWPNSRITNEIREICLRFYEVVPSSRIGPKFVNFFKT